MRLFCAFDSAFDSAFHSAFHSAFDSASGWGRHFSPHIGTALWRSTCPFRGQVMPFAYAWRDTQSAGTHGCRGLARTWNSLPVEVRQRLPRNTYTRFYFDYMRSTDRSLKGPVAPCGRRDAIKTPASCGRRRVAPAASAGRTNALTITPPSHRSRHFCNGDAIMCQHDSRSALSCSALTRPPNRMFDYVA